MRIMVRSQLARWFAVWFAVASVALGPATAYAQDRVVGREALDPKDRETLPPSIDGRTDSEEDVDPRALEDFREPLAPHGAWIDDPRYGTIWVPDARVVGPDFTPYQTAGHWELTSDADWLWVSDYAWGDIPFHYGRWVWVDGHGWSWVPGRVWAPAWVVWRTGPYGYIGWGPCPPTWGWYGGSAVWLWWPPPAPYWFVETRYVFVDRVHTHVIREPARVANAARQTTPQRQPASPGNKRSLDAHRPARPDFDKLRYAGPEPKRSVVQHPDVGPADGSTARRPGASRPVRGDGGVARPGSPRGARGVQRAPEGRAGRGLTPSTRPSRPTPTDEPRGIDPRRTPRDGGDRERPSAAPERESRAPRNPSTPRTETPSRTRDVGPSPSLDRGPAAAPRPAPAPSAAPTFKRAAPSAPSPARAPHRAAPRRR